MGQASSIQPAATTLSISGTLPTNVAPLGYMGVFGNGLFRSFPANDTFTIPTGVTKIRVRVVGAGGGGKNAGTGGGGGGYAHGVFNVTPGTPYAITVGTGGTGGTSPTAGGTSSLGALISATGGGAGQASAAAVGGTGTGGDFQATGGGSGAARR